MAKQEYEASLEHGAPSALVVFGYANRFDGENAFGYADGAARTRVQVDWVETANGRKFNRTSYIYCEPTQIRLEARDETEGLDNIAQKIQIDSASEIAAFLQDEGSLIAPVRCVVFEGHHSDPQKQFVRTFTGLVSSSERKADGFTEIVVDPVATAMTRPGLRRNYQRYCPFALYGKSCGATTDGIRVRGVKTNEVGSNYFTLFDIWPNSLVVTGNSNLESRRIALRTEFGIQNYPYDSRLRLGDQQGTKYFGDHFHAAMKELSPQERRLKFKKMFIGGYVEWMRDGVILRRTIYDVEAELEGAPPNGADSFWNGQEWTGGYDKIILSGEIPGIESGDAMPDMILGCSHDYSQCRNLHDNIENFGGFIHIPSRNPIENINHSFV